MVRQRPGRARVALDVPVLLPPGLRQPVPLRPEPPAHRHDLGLGTPPRTGRLEQSQVRAGPDRDDRRAGADACVEQVDRRFRRRRPRGDRGLPQRRVLQLAHAASGERQSRAGDDRNVVPAEQLQEVDEVAGAPAARSAVVVIAHDLDAGPAEHHRDGACVVRVPAEVRVDVDPHRPPP
jgi:hypothetical protein